MKNRITQLRQYALPVIKAGKSEHGEKDQAKIRFIVAILLGLYCMFYVDPTASTSSTSNSLLMIFAALSSSAVIFYSWIAISPQRNHIRVILAIIVDLGLLTYAMSIANAYAGPWYPVYLWVTFGNGFRYGIKYLFIATIISVIGFSVVLIANSWWDNHIATGIGLLIGLIILPLYVSTLLRSLQSAISSANEANETKSRFLANMSHELRTPLNGVIATADLLKETVNSSGPKEMVSTISNSAEALLDLINQILDIGKIEAGKMQVEKIPFNLRSLIKSAIDIISPSAEKKGLPLYSYIDANIPDALVGDPTQTRQILVNLLSNSVKFTHNGHVTLRVLLNKNNGSEANILFDVSDTGIGIHENGQSRIFDAFTQADESTTREYGGTGLGTAICKELAELMGGNIKLSSKPGIGTTFKVQIPFKYEENQINTDCLSGLHVIMVSNDHTTSELMTSRLRKLDIHVDLASNNTIASQLVNHNKGKSRPVSAIICSGDADKDQLLELSSSLDSETHMHGVGLITLGGENAAQEKVKHTAFRTCLEGTPTDIQIYNALISCNLVDADSNHNNSPENDKGITDIQRMNILVADDNATNRKVILMVMNQLGHNADIVTNGIEALDALETKTYDAVIVDKNMPELGGFDVYKTYKFTNPESTLPFILLTADATNQSVERARDLGFDSYITKPFRPKELQNTLQKLSQINVNKAQTFLQDVQNATQNDIQELTSLDSDVLDQLVSLSANNHGFIPELISGFINDAERAITLMETSLISRDYEKYSDYAHAIKGSSGSIGAKLIYEICAEVGEATFSELSERGPDLLSKLKVAFTETKIDLEKYSEDPDYSSAANSG